MSAIPWLKRKSRLRVLLQSQASEDEDGVALDRLLHGQRVIGKTAKTTEIDTLRFQDSDLQVVGTLEYGQFGIIDVVTCTIDGRVYVRKSTEKVFASRTRDQCSPQIERNILLQAAKTDSPWAPHLFCAYQNSTHLNLVMDYAEGGSLWDVLESSPTRGRLPEEHVTRWWAPQIISAIDWCHSQGFVHRDIKPHNFVLTPTAHILLIDFGSAAPLLPPEADGSRRLAREHCMVPCGTCDYISPEILKAHERALVAIELEDDSQASILVDDECDAYGLETDWWSLGAMLFEMVYGVAPFFAEDIRRTYTKITDHKRHLSFNSSSKVSLELQDLLRGLLTDAEFRLGRCDAGDITSAAVFVGVDWSSLTSVVAPPGLHVPQFTYAEPVAAGWDQKSQAFGFDALFESSPGGYTAAGSLAQSTRSRSQTESIIGSALLNASVSSRTSSASDDRPSPLSFIGFSWGPVIDETPSLVIATSSPALLSVPTLTPARPLLPIPFATPLPKGLQPGYAFSTPIKPNARGLLTPFQTAKSKPGVSSTTRRRELSDREAMRQMVDCIGMSARKRVLESGRKPRTKALRDRSLSKSYTQPQSFGARKGPQPIDTALGGVRSGRFVIVDRTQDSGMTSQLVDTDLESGLDGTSDGEDERDLIMMSPSPSPRPGSAMSMTMSRRSNEPTVSLFLNPSTASLTAPLSSRWNGNGHGQGHADTSRSSSRMRQSRGSIEEVGLNEDILDEMEDKYGMLMYDIEGLESRLRRLSTSSNHSL